MSKEKLNINRPPETLFIGLGGIGSEIVTRIAELCRPGEEENLRFVAMDTNANDLKCVRESRAHIVPIQTSSTQSVLDYLINDDDARTKWFPNNTTLYPKTVSEGAGQVRAISRLALNATIRTGEIQKLYKAIDDLFLKDGSEGSQALRVVIVASATGGTGSGIATAIGMLIREYLHKHYREKAAIVRGFLLLPGVMDTVIKTQAEQEALRRNGYAMIKELNAFMIKASGFCGVRKDLARYADLHIDIPTTTGGTERLENLPMDFCFLLDRVDQSQENMKTLDQYKDFAAQSLYEQNIGPMQGKAFSMEDNIIKEFANGTNLGRNRFGGIGSSVIRYPYEEIADYVAYTRAIERIGGGGAAGDWLKYDNQYKQSLAEYRQKRLMASGGEPKIEQIYVDALSNDNNRFGMGVKESYLSKTPDEAAKTRDEVNERVEEYLNDFALEIIHEFENDTSAQTLNTKVNDLKKEIDYENDPQLRKGVSDSLTDLRQFQSLIQRNAESIARLRARSIFFGAPNIRGDNIKEFSLESLLRTSRGSMHPNAARFILYMVKIELNNRLSTESGNLKKALKQLERFSADADDDSFDLHYRFSKKEEKSIDDVVGIVTEKGDDDVSLSDKLSGFNNIWAEINGLYQAYSGALFKYRDAKLKLSAYGAALEYIDSLCKEYESFYSSFESKIVSLERAKEDIVDALRFNKGDSVRNVCGDQKSLERLSTMCPEGSDGLLIPDELNAEIFEAIKKNAESERLAAYDPYGDHDKIDIFDSVLIQYFRDSARDDCDEVINLNIVQALALEKKFKEYFKAESLTEDGEEVIPGAVSFADKTEYIKDGIKMGAKLASSGISFATMDEPRDITLCAFNKKLTEMRDINVKRLVESFAYSPVETDTVSKYELRFFKALYNITPDELSRFKSSEVRKNGDAVLSVEPAGIYYEAYHKYIKNIGPDSTKSATISLHIDKRWDSLTELPEISMAAHYDEMIRIHSALIYGIIYGLIKKHPSSRYDENKRIFALEDHDGDLIPLVVSNNTECDEFYEVLDALYRDRASVSKIYDIIEDRCAFDVQGNHRYDETEFFAETSKFKIGDSHAAPTSLFEIPLLYFNSLPRAFLDDNELAIMVDSVIRVMETEVSRYEQEKDRAPYLSKRLVSQFELFVNNFNKAENDDIRKNSKLNENTVVNIVFKKVNNKLKELRTSDFSEKIEKLRALLNA